MCLAIDVFPLQEGSVSFEAVSTPRYAVPVEVCGGQLTISEEGGCACSLLAEGADWNSSTWRLRPGIRKPLAETIRALGEQFPAGFALQAIWIGDPVKHEIPISTSELAGMIRNDRLGNWTRYIVHPTGLNPASASTA